MTKLALSFIVVASLAVRSTGKGLRGPEDTPQTKIVGGTTASLSDFPFFVDLDGCGGSLIWEDSKFPEVRGAIAYT